MVRKTYLSEQIINKLREAEIHINQYIPIVETKPEDWHHPADLLSMV